jgi:hypothetical protein
MTNTSQFRRLIRFCPLTVIIASLTLALRAAPALAQVQNLCLQEIDGVVAPDSFGNISTPESCDLDEVGSGILGNNNAWGGFIGQASGSTISDPPSGTGAGGAFSGVLATVPDQLTQGTKITDPSTEPRFNGFTRSHQEVRLKPISSRGRLAPTFTPRVRLFSLEDRRLAIRSSTTC